MGHQVRPNVSRPAMEHTQARFSDVLQLYVIPPTPTNLATRTKPTVALEEPEPEVGSIAAPTQVQLVPVLKQSRTLSVGMLLLKQKHSLVCVRSEVIAAP